LSWGSRSIVKMGVQDINAQNFYSHMEVARKAFREGRPIGEVDYLFSAATSHYFKIPEESRVSDMKKDIDNFELDVGHWRSEK